MGAGSTRNGKYQHFLMCELWYSALPSYPFVGAPRTKV